MTPLPGALDIEFERPPVTEVALSVAFRTLPLGFQDLVTIWLDRFRDNFPNLEEQPPITMPVEPSDAPSHPTVSFQIGLELPGPRLWMLDETRNHLVQLQKDFVAFNWRRLDEPDAEYPRYSSMRQRFESVLETLLTEVGARTANGIAPTQAEITYINHIAAPSGRGPYRLDEVLSMPGIAPLDGLGQPESQRVGLTYKLIEAQQQVGRLHVTAEHGVRRSDGSPLIALTLTARGVPLGEPSIAGVIRFLTYGSDVALRAFVGLTTATVQSEWGRRTR